MHSTPVRLALCLGILGAPLPIAAANAGPQQLAAADDGDTAPAKKKKKHRRTNDASTDAKDDANVPPYGPDREPSAAAPQAAATPAPAPAPSPAPAPAPAPAPVPVAQYPASEPTAAEPLPPARDHEAQMGHWALASFYTASVAVGVPSSSGVNAAGLTVSPSVVTTPVIGVRYWLTHIGGFDMGIDVGIGLDVTGSSTSGQLVLNNGTTTTTTDSSQGALSPSGLTIHLGAPLEITGGHHYSFDIIPQLNLGFGWATDSVTGAQVSSNGFVIEIGASAGPEITFGYFDMPQLVLQPTIGVLFHHDNYSGTVTAGNNKASQTVNDNDLFALATSAAISIFYYF